MKITFMLEIQKAQYLTDYKIHFSFNNGKAGTANFEEFLFNDQRVIFSKLKDKQNFKSFELAHGTIVWSDELDIAPEYLFYLAFMHDSEFQEQFEQWGYTAATQTEN